MVVRVRHDGPRRHDALLGDDRSLDTFSDPPNVCFMGTTGKFTGQF
jgi:hypothetical protein